MTDEVWIQFSKDGTITRLSRQDLEKRGLIVWLCAPSVPFLPAIPGRREYGNCELCDRPIVFDPRQPPPNTVKVCFGCFSAIETSPRH